MPKVNYLFTNNSLILFFYINNFILLYYLEDKAKFIEFKAKLLTIYKI